MKFDVITFGSAVTDVFVNTDISKKKNFICYNVGSKILIKELRFDIGGGGTNTAVAFARAGLKTGCICGIGKDNNGKEILSLLKKEKVKFLGKIEKNKKEATGYSIILDSRGGDRTILTFKGPNNDIKLDDIKLRKLKTKWLYYSSLLGKSLETQKKLARILKTKRNTKLAFNPSMYLIKKENLFSLLKLCDLLILNKEEAQTLTGKKENLLENLHKLINKQGIVVITDKNKLISCYDGKKKHFLKPHKIKVIERTGAGDAFASGFVAGQIARKSIPYSMALGLRESESVIRYFGAKNKLLRMKIR